MKRTALLLVVGTILLTTPGGIAFAGDSQTLMGEFHWTGRDNRGALEAIFTPDGENKWNVAFHFEFRGKRHVWEGMAEGNLSEGGLKGEVKNEDKRRTFTFTGSFADGRFSGTHAEVGGSGKKETGTLTLGK